MGTVARRSGSWSGCATMSLSRSLSRTPEPSLTRASPPGRGALGSAQAVKHRALRPDRSAIGRDAGEIPPLEVFRADQLAFVPRVVRVIEQDVAPDPHLAERRA